MSFTLQASGLEPGHAVTIWWMVVNPHGGVAVLYAAGHVIGQDGTATIAGYLPVGDSDGYAMAPPLLPRPPLRGHPQRCGNPDQWSIRLELAIWSCA